MYLICWVRVILLDSLLDSLQLNVSNFSATEFIYIVITLHS